MRRCKTYRTGLYRNQPQHFTGLWNNFWSLCKHSHPSHIHPNPPTRISEVSTWKPNHPPTYPHKHMHTQGGLHRYTDKEMHVQLPKVCAEGINEEQTKGTFCQTKEKIALQTEIWHSAGIISRWIWDSSWYLPPNNISRYICWPWFASSAWPQAILLAAVAWYLR